jgi:MinD-like ATPase involved in chromosome partitioning or flagellar assembly
MGKIVSIHSFRGGTGKSNTTANLAALIALEGKRVAVVDTDIQSPGIHVLFGLDENKMGLTLNDYLQGKCKIEDVALNIGEVVEEAQGRKQLAGKTLWLVPSSIRSREIRKVIQEGYDVNQLNEGFHDLIERLQLDYLLIDTHPGLNDETLLSVAISDVLIIIMRPDQQDFQGTAVTVDIATSLDVPHLFLVVNKVLSRYDFDQVQKQVEDFYDQKVASVLPLSEDIVDMGSADIFALVSPEHRWSQGIQAITQTVINAE